MMQKLANIKWKHYVNYILVAVALVVFMCLSFGGGLRNSHLEMIEKASISIILAVSLSLVVGFLGELSLGHAGFMCVGAYLGCKAAVMLQEAIGNDLPDAVALLAALLVGGAVAALCGFVIGLPALRLKGDYLAIVTLAFGEIVRSLFLNSSDESFGGTLGLDTSSLRYDRKELFIFGLLLVLVTLFVIQNLMRSRHGRAITAIRDSEIAAHATGINVTKYKLLVFVVAAFFAGIAGVLYGFSNYTVESSVFDYNYSIEILVMVVLGGMGSVTGAVVAATLITVLNSWLPTVLTGDLAVLQNLLYALVLILVVIYGNAPALKNFRETHNLRVLTEKFSKRKKDPAHIKDDDASWARIPTKIPMDEILSVDVTPGESRSLLRPDKPDGKGDE